MTGALIILVVLVLVGVVLYVHHRLTSSRDDKPAVEPATGCCGLHAVCEKINDDKVVYYDDEELDRFIGRKPDSYTVAEEDELRDVMLTLRPDEVASWYHSLTLRGIMLPDTLRDELMLLVSEKQYS